MSAPTATDLLNVARDVLPTWFSQTGRAEEDLYAFSLIAEDAGEIVAFWLSQTNILDAVGATGTEPDWLNQHAKDRGTRRTPGETDALLRSRLRNVPDALTRSPLLSGIQAILTAEGISGAPAMLELRRDKAYLREYLNDTGTGGTFSAGTGTTMRFEPTAGFARPPYYAGVFPGYGYRMTFSGALSAFNNGIYTVTGLYENAVEFTNSSGVPMIDGVVTWAAQKLDQDGNLADSFQHTYLSRGYRIGRGSGAMMIIVILPYGSTAQTAANVEEFLRQKKGAGIIVLVERRLVP